MKRFQRTLQCPQLIFCGSCEGGVGRPRGPARTSHPPKSARRLRPSGGIVLHPLLTAALRR